jgi:fibronectin-binding autotransporter adhesin
MKLRIPSTFRLSFPLASAIAALLAVSHTQAATFYWDNNNTALGFGNAGGTWAQNSTSGGTSARWKTDPAGLIAGSATQATGNGDIFNFGTPAFGLGSGTITVSGAVNMGDTLFGSASGAVVLSGGTINFGAAKTISVNNASNTITSVIGGAATSLTKAGTGTLVLTGANSYTGTTIINGGTLDLGGGTASGSVDSTALTLGGGTLSYTRTGGTTEEFITTSINGGGTSRISVVSGNTLNLGTVSRGAGGFIDFSSVGAGSVDALAGSNDSTGIMGGLVFTDSWAVANGAGSPFSGLANGSYTQSSTALDTAANYNGLNIDVDSSQAPDAAITANSLRFSSAAANTLTLQGANIITSGGILVGSGVGSNLSTITGGTLAGADSKDLSIIQNNTFGGLTIASEITDHIGATALTKSGSGLLTLADSNTFTGGLFLNDGRLELADPGALNSTTPNNVTLAGGTLALSGNPLTVPVLRGSNAVSGVIENGGATHATMTISGSTGSNFAGILQDGSGGGTLALAKSGSGSLTLSGPSTFTGGTTVAGGTVFISNATSFGTGPVSVTDNSKFSVTGGVTYVNAINVGAALTLQVPTVTLGTATYSGQLTGASDITVEATLVNGATGTHSFTNSTNAFTGNVLMPVGSTGTGSGNDFVSFSSIGDGGTFTFRKRGHTNAIIYDGSSAITFNTRQIAMSGDYGGVFDGGGVNPVNRFLNNATDPAHTVTFNSNITPGTIFQAGTFFFGGSNTGDNTFAGIISNASNFDFGIGKTDAGRWILTGANTYLGNALIANGTLSVNSIVAAANAQPLGQGPLIQLGNSGTSGTLEYTGASNGSTDKQVVLGNLANNNQTGAGGVVNNSSTGRLTFSNPTFNSIAGATVTTVSRTLTLGGSYDGSNGANEIQGVVQNNATGAAVAVTVSGSAWKLGGANTYTGATIINNGGTLILSGSNNSSAATTIATGGGTLQLDSAANGGLAGGNLNINAAGAVIQALNADRSFSNPVIMNGNLGAAPTFSGTNSITLTGNLRVNNADVTLTNNVASGKTLTINTIDRDGTNNRNLTIGGTGATTVNGIITLSAGSLTKDGSGTLTLGAANAYTGATTINNGTLVITGATQATTSISFATGGRLGLDTGSPVTASSATVNLTDGAIEVTGATGAPSYTLLTAASITGTPVLASPVPGYELQIPPGNTELRLVQTGAPAGFSAWQSANGTDGGLGEDHDNDGVSNGTEYFLGGTAITTGFTALPSVVNTAGILSVTWTKAGTYTGTYGTDFTVETSATLAGPWTTESVGVSVTITGNDVKYTFPGGPAYSGKSFARLKVTGP